MKPNVIVILTDDQGYGDLGCHGNPVLKTPHLDRLHHESLRFTDFHVAPVCAPTRGQLMTGCDAFTNGASGVHCGKIFMRQGIPTMPEIFAANGYRTGLFGKWHLGDNYPHRPMDRGFQEAVYHQGGVIGWATDYWGNDYFDDHYRHNGEVKPYRGYCTDVWFREAIAWMKERAKNREPFFLYLATNGDHIPLFVPDQYRAPYRHLGLNLASFFGMIACFDENMGRFEAALRETGLRDNTLVVFSTDNGGTVGVWENFYNAGMRGGKGELYDGGHRVPCFIRWPGHAGTPRDIDTLAECQDLLPTLIDLCELRAPAHVAFEGASLAGLIRGKTLKDRMLVVQFNLIQDAFKKWDCAVLWDKWRLLNGKELYHVQSDPGQENDLVVRHPEVVQRMRAHYEAWWKAHESSMGKAETINIGSDQENPVMLGCVDWFTSMTPEQMPVQYQTGIRKGISWNGSWELFVEKAGDYEISLCRWPEEAEGAVAGSVAAFIPADRAFESARESEIPLWFKNGHGGSFPEGKKLAVTMARCAIGPHDLKKTVGRDDRAVVFAVSLPEGKASLKTWFYDRAGNELCGAYYAYVRKTQE